MARLINPIKHLVYGGLLVNAEHSRRSIIVQLVIVIVTNLLPA